MLFRRKFHWKQEHQNQSIPSENRGEWLLRVGLILLCLLLVAAVTANYLHWRDHRDQLLTVLAAARVDEFNTVASQRIQYETGVHHAQTLAARALVHQVMNFDTDSEGSPELSEQEQVRGLETAERLAKSALLAQPNDWQAAMLLGASRYLIWSIHQDRRLFNKASSWEAPLKWAVETADGKVQPRRLLAAAYLETWWALSAQKKEFARDLLATTFRHDEQAFIHLAPLWLKAARSQEDAFSLIPKTPFAWSVLRSHYRRAEDWPSVARVYQRQLLALEHRLETNLEEAKERLRLGDIDGGRTLCLAILSAAPAQARFASVVGRALELYPPGLHRLRSTAPLADWMHFVLTLDLQGRQILPPSAVNRLSDLLEDLKPPQYFHAALFGNDVWRLREAENRPRPTRSWTPFLLAQARRQLAAGNLDAAADSLHRIDPISKRLLLYTHLHHQLLTANDDTNDTDANDDTDSAASERALAPFYRLHWSALEWRGGSRRSHLFFLPAAKSSGLRIEIVLAPDQGGVVEFLLDGALIDIREAQRRRSLIVETPIAAGLHLLEMRSLAGEQISAGMVALL
jgi:hypothetical protein